MNQGWVVHAFRAVEDGVVVDGNFGGDELTLLFRVGASPGGVTVVSRPSEPQNAPVASGGSQQSALEAIRLFFEVSSTKGLMS